MSPPRRLVPGEASAPIVILPEEMRGEIGVYSDASVTLAKRLRDQGLDASYQQDFQHRTWRGRKGGPLVTALDIEVAIPVLSDAFFFALQQLLEWRGSRHPIKLRVAHRVEGEFASSTDVFEGEGLHTEVVAAFRTFEEGRRDRE
ncbi:MAG: hypothetical protein WB116_11905 [Candidatus Dormiibacterota bacterium]